LPFVPVRYFEPPAKRAAIPKIGPFVVLSLVWKWIKSS
jgi:hypothetical protein